MKLGGKKFWIRQGLTITVSCHSALLEKKKRKHTHTHTDKQDEFRNFETQTSIVTVLDKSYNISEPNSDGDALKMDVLDRKKKEILEDKCQKNYWFTVFTVNIFLIKRYME